MDEENDTYGVVGGHIFQVILELTRINFMEDRIMQKQFDTFCGNIRLTEKQEEDAKTKYDGVCETLNNYYYKSKYDGTTKFLFGSYKKRTNIRPLTTSQDVDVIFKMPIEEFDKYKNAAGNGPSALLQKIKDILKDKYTTTDKIKGWGRVVLIQFTDGTHNVEVVPAWEQENGTFRIPNTEAGGRWETFNPRNDINSFQKSNNNTKGLTTDLTRILKKWKREVSSLTLDSYEIENYIIDFLSGYTASNKDYDVIVRDSFVYLHDSVDGSNKSYIETALNRANNAVDYAEKENYQKANDEWQEIFGDEFPAYKAGKIPSKSKSNKKFLIVNTPKPHGYQIK